mgnify:CR=1 FL=1|jgi:hypothetical protein
MRQAVWLVPPPGKLPSFCADDATETTDAATQSGSDGEVRPFQRLCLPVAPAALIANELFRPAGFTEQPGMFHFLSHAEPHAPRASLLARLLRTAMVARAHLIQMPMIDLSPSARC